MAASPIGFLLSGIEPRGDRLWNVAAFRRAFWTEARRVGLEVKRASLARGLDKDGKRLAPIHPLTEIARRDDVNPYTGERPYSTRGRARVKYPPLQATGPRSRTIRLLTGEIRRDGVWFYWGVDSDTGRDWGEILARHAAGFSAHFRYPSEGWGYVKPRNVIGLSPADLRTIKQRMDGWVERERRKYPVVERKQPTPLPVQPAPIGGDMSYLPPGTYSVTGLAGNATQLPGSQLSMFVGQSQRRPFGPRPPRGRVTPPPPPKPPVLPARAVVPAKPPGVNDVRKPIPVYLLERMPVNIRARTLGDLFRNPLGWWWWLTIGLGLWLARTVEAVDSEYEGAK